MSPFYVGQKVVCVDARKRGNPYRVRQYPVKGAVYTIRGFNRAGTAILLEEIINPPVAWSGGFGEPLFYTSRFRPVVNTDISIFTAMLKTTKLGADA